jgi:serine/threonine protein kinase
VQGYTLAEYIKEKEISKAIKTKGQTVNKTDRASLEVASSSFQPGTQGAASTSGNNQIIHILEEEKNQDGAAFESSKPTFFTEVEAIDLLLKIVELLELLHSRNMVHTNLSPSEIFLKEKKYTQMQYLNLFHCIPQAYQDIGFKHIDSAISISAFDTRLRNMEYISPEQIQVGLELSEIAQQNNGMIDNSSQLVQDFKLENEHKISKQCDLYSLGAILFKCLLGAPPDQTISQ